MKLNLYLTLAFLLWGGITNAQNFCLDLEQLSIDGSTITFRIMISGTEEFGLGSSNFQFSFNEDAISNPLLVSTPLSEFPPYFYSSHTVTNPAEGEASFNIELASANDFSFLVTEVQAEIAQISFEILDLGMDMELAWSYNGSSTETVVYHENEVDQLLAEDIPCLEVSEAILPISLAQFDVEKRDADALLSWSTVTEINFSHFEIESSFDLSTWDKLGEQNGYGNSVVRRDYSFVDINPSSAFDFKSDVYYRLKSVDVDGTYSYSQLRVLTFKDELENFKLELFPNPARDYVNISYKGSNYKNLQLKIMDNAGKIVFTKSIVEAEGKSLLELNITDLREGIYFLQLTSANESIATKKLLKAEN